MIVGTIMSNLWVKLVGMKSELEVAKSLLEVEDPSAKFSYRYKKNSWDGKKKLYSERQETQEIIIGYGLIDWLAKNLYTKGIDFAFKGSIPLLSYKDDWDKLPLKLREYQRKSIEVALERQSGLLHLATNAGKTLIASAILKAFREHQCLYIVHRRELFKQSYDYFKDMLKCDIGSICSGKATEIKNITVAMIGTLYSRGKTSKQIKSYLESVKVIILDECHHGASTTYKKVVEQAYNSTVRIGMSGTIPEEYTLPGLILKGLYGDTLYRVTNGDLATLGVSAPMQIIMMRGDWYLDDLLPSAKKLFGKPIMNPRTAYWNHVYEGGILNNKSRNEFICKVVTKVKNTGGVLVIVDRLDHGQVLYDSIRDNGKVKYIFADAPERQEALEDFKRGRVDVLISSPILGEGVDISGIYTLVLASGGKSKRKLLQRIGRGLRKKADNKTLTVYDFYDTSVPLLERHSKERIDVYKKEGFEVIMQEDVL